MTPRLRKKTVYYRKTIQPDHKILEKMNLNLGKNSIVFQLKGNLDRIYQIKARIFYYDNKNPHKVNFLLIIILNILLAFLKIKVKRIFLKIICIKLNKIIFCELK